MDALLIIAVASCIGISTGLLGSFLMLRGMAMIGDAISHAVLPGIVLAFLFSKSRDPFVMLLGAGATGMMTAMLIQFLHEKVNLQSDAAIGLTFTTFFALGVVLITYYAGHVDVDQECVLYGEIAYVPVDVWTLPVDTWWLAAGTDMGPRALYINGATLGLVLLFILWCYRPLVLTSFDAPYAKALGMRVAYWHHLLMGVVSFVVVSSFESVGAILVVAFLIAPPATAYLLTRRLRVLLWLVVFLEVITAVFGYYFAYFLNLSIGGAMASVSGVLFFLCFFFSLLRRYFLTPRNQQPPQQDARKQAHAQ